MNRSLLKYPSAYVPLLISTACLGLVLGHYALNGNVHETDEGTPAHLFQILMVVQAPIVLYFAITWMPRNPAKALPIMALHAMGIIAAFAAVYFLT